MEELNLEFEAPWCNIPFEEETHQLQIEEYLGESVELIPNDDGVEEPTPVHKYKVKKL